MSAKEFTIAVVLGVALCGSPVAARDRVYYFHNDHLGTPQTMTHQSGRVVWQADYDPFGKATVNPDPDGDGQQVENNMRFPGQYYDAETGLHYNWHRYYEPETGRYLQPDPIGLDGGLNPYNYVESNPLINIDPFGLELVSAEEGRKIAATAETWVGVPYKMGGSARSGVDCSHLTFLVYGEAGFPYGYVDSSNFPPGQFKKVSSPQDGDIVKFRRHLGIIDRDKLVSAQSGAGKVSLGDPSWFGEVLGYYRYDKDECCE
jgi:RHS repeat-associated protein